MDDCLVEQQTILEVIATAETLALRRRALDLALVALDHRDTQAHDAVSGAIVLVTRCLQRDESILRDEDQQFLNSYFQLITVLFRCSDTKAIEGFEKVGADLVSLILIEHAETHRSLTKCGFVTRRFDSEKR